MTATALVAVLIILGLIVFWPSHKGPASRQTQKTLADYASTSAEVQLTIDGTVNGDDLHRQIRMTIDRGSREIDIIKGYQGTVIQSKKYSNNEDGFRVFLKSLSNGGFRLKRQTKVTDEEGVCPQGFRYIFQLKNSGDKNTDSRLWSSDCGGGTFGGQSALIVDLFKAQITGYDEIAGPVEL